MITTINVDNTMTVQEIEAAIAAVDRFIPYGDSVVIQFADGVYTVNERIDISGFYGAGVLIVQGNREEADHDAKHTTQQVILDGSGAPAATGVIRFDSCTPQQVQVRNLKTLFNNLEPCIAIEFIFCSFGYALWNYIHGTSAGSHYGHCLQFAFTPTSRCRQNVVGYSGYGISALHGSQVLSDDNMSNGVNDQPYYGLHGKYGGVVARVTGVSQPAGTNNAIREEHGGKVW